MERLPPIVWDPEKNEPAEQARLGWGVWTIVVLIYLSIAQLMVIHGLAAWGRHDYLRVLLAVAVIVYGVVDLTGTFVSVYRREKMNESFPKYTPWIALALIVYVLF